MRKFCVWLQLLFNNYAKYKLFRLQDIGKSIYGVDSQGIDVYNDRYIFQGNDISSKLATLLVIDLIDKKIVTEICLDLPGCHMNNINIGKKLNPNNKYPLLYISECRNKHRCYVVSLPDNFEAGTYSVIQEIYFDSKEHYGGSKNSFDWFVTDKYIYTFGVTGVTDEIEVIKFKLPDVVLSTKVFTDKDIISSFKVKDCHIYQGSKAINGKLYAPFGYGTKNDPAYLKVIDLETGKVEKNINICGLGELEGIGKYGKGFIVSNNAINPTYTYIELK